jgi:type II secretory pathway component PulJ
LLEVLCSAFLGALILGATAVLTRRAADISASQQAVDQSLEAAQVTLAGLARELRASLKVVEPVTGTSPNLALEVYSKQRQEWLPTPIPNPVPDAWEPRALDQVQIVRYFANGEGALIRDLAANRATLCDRVQGFQATLLDQGIEVQLRVKLVQRDQLLVVRVARRTDSAP